MSAYIAAPPFSPLSSSPPFSKGPSPPSSSLAPWRIIQAEATGGAERPHLHTYKSTLFKVDKCCKKKERGKRSVVMTSIWPFLVFFLRMGNDDDDEERKRRKTMVSLALAPIAVLSSGRRRRRRRRLSCKNFQRRAASPSDVRLMETPLFCACPFLSFGAF